MRLASSIFFLGIIHPSLQWFDYSGNLLFIHQKLINLIDNQSLSDQSNWPGVCNKGKNQSPIDLGTKKVEKSSTKDRFVREFSVIKIFEILL